KSVLLQISEFSKRNTHCCGLHCARIVDVFPVNRVVAAAADIPEAATASRESGPDRQPPSRVSARYIGLESLAYARARKVNRCIRSSVARKDETDQHRRCASHGSKNSQTSG